MPVNSPEKNALIGSQYRQMSRPAVMNAARIRPGIPSSEARMTLKPENAMPSVEIPPVAVIDEMPIMLRIRRSFAGAEDKTGGNAGNTHRPGKDSQRPTDKDHRLRQPRVSLTHSLADVIKSLNP